MNKKYDVLKDTSDVDESLDEIIKTNPKKLPIAADSEENEFTNAVAKISDEVMKQVSDISLITLNDVAELKKAEAFVLETYTDVRQYRPMINKLTSVISDGRFPTADAKFWQSKAEAEVHFNELKRDMFKYDRAKVDIDEITYKIDSIAGMLEGEHEVTEQFDPNLVRFDLKRLEIKRSQYVFEMKQLEKTIKYRIEEVTDWFKIASSYESKCTYSTRDPNEHVADTHFKMLMWQVQNAKTEEERNVFEDQLKTFKRLIGNQKAYDNATKAANNATLQDKDRS